jgi:hypothetical protein
VGCDSIETNFVELCNVSPFKEEVVNGRRGEMVKSKIKKDVKSSVSAILNFFQHSVIKSGDIRPRLILVDVFSTIAISRLVTKENVQLN